MCIFRQRLPMSCVYNTSVLGVCTGCPNGVLAHSRSGGVRWRLLHPTRTAAAIDREDSYAHVRQADILLVHKGLGKLLCRQQTEARRHGGIHEGRTRRIRGAGEVVKGGGCWVENVGRPYQEVTRNGLSIETPCHQ